MEWRTKGELAVFYEGHQLQTKYKPDLLVYGSVVVEIKAVSELISDHEAQLFNYLRISRKNVGYLINHGLRKFEPTGGSGRKLTIPFGAGLSGMPLVDPACEQTSLPAS